MTSDGDDYQEMRMKFSSLIAPHLEPLFNIVDRLFTRYGIEIPIEFWFVTILAINSIIIYYEKISFELSISFIFLAILLLMASNIELITKTVSTRIKRNSAKIPETTRFLNGLDTRNLTEVQKFLRNYRKLSYSEITTILQSKFSEHPSIHQSIIKYQNISSELIEYIIDRKIDEKISESLLSDYIYGTKDDISSKYYKIIKRKYSGSKEILKSLHVSYPLHSSGRTLFFRFANWRIIIRDWFNYGSGDGVFGFIALIPTVIASIQLCLTDLSWRIPSGDTIGTVLLGINFLMAGFIIWGLMFILMKGTAKIILSIVKWLLYIFAPTKN